MQMCNVYAFLFEDDARFWEALKALAAFFEVRYPGPEEFENRVRHFLAFISTHLAPHGYCIDTKQGKVFLAPLEERERYDPKIFVMLAPFMQDGSYMRIYDSEKGELLCWILYQEKLLQLVPRWEVDRSLEEVVESYTKEGFFE